MPTSHTHSVVSSFFPPFSCLPFFLTNVQFPPLFSQTHSVAFGIQKNIVPLFSITLSVPSPFFSVLSLPSAFIKIIFFFFSLLFTSLSPFFSLLYCYLPP